MGRRSELREVFPGDGPRQGAIVRAVARHRGVAPQMYSGVGLRAVEASAMRAAVDPLLDEIEGVAGALRRANGSMRKGDDPGGVWVRFPEDAWAELQPIVFRSGTVEARREARDEPHAFIPDPTRPGTNWCAVAGCRRTIAEHEVWGS